MKKTRNGFSLIELMIVVAIIGVLTVIALPRYQNFIAKAEFTETKLAVGAVKVGIEVCVQMLGMANSNRCVSDSHGIPADVDLEDESVAEGEVGVMLTGTAPGKSANVTDGDTFVITTTAPLGSRNGGATFTLSGTLDNQGRVLWDEGVCSDTELC